MNMQLEPVLAYLDPGTGSIVVQVIVAAFLSVGIFFRQAIFAPWSFFCGSTPEKKNEEAVQTKQEESREPAETIAK